MLKEFFKLEENNTTISREFIAGVMSFLSAAYILGVNGSMFSKGGMDPSAVIFATAIASCIACILIGLISNFPAVLIPGMGLNAMFNYTIILSMGNSWETAVAAVFVSSALFLLITVSGLTDTIINIIPPDLKIGIGLGIGLFLIFVGLQSSRLIVSDPFTLVSIGNLLTVPSLVVLLGIVINMIFYLQKVPSSIFLGLMITLAFGLLCTFLGLGDGHYFMPSIPSQVISANLDWSLFGGLLRGFGQLFSNIPNLIVMLFSLLFVTLFDTIGAVFSLSREADLIDEEGKPNNAKRIFAGEALGGIIGSIFGTSTMVVSVESAAGIGIGGRTGLTSLFAGIFFLISIFFTPLILSLFTQVITSPILIVVGFMILSQLKDIDWHDNVTIISALTTIFMMSFTSSIALGIALGFVTYSAATIAMGRYGELNLGMKLLSILFLIFLFFGL